MKRGLWTLPESVKNLTSLFEISRTIEISLGISRVRLSSFMHLTRSSALLWVPTHLPLTKIFTHFPSPTDYWLTTLNGSTPKSSRIDTSWVAVDPTETNAINARFFTNPHAAPSGVSDGQIIPQCVLWSYLGFASLPVFAIGVLSLRRWEIDDIKVSLFNTWATPVLIVSPFLSLPQFPVARAVFKPLVIISLLMALLISISFDPLSISFLRIFYITSVKTLKSYLKWVESKEPAMSSLFFP